MTEPEQTRPDEPATEAQSEVETSTGGEGTEEATIDQARAGDDPAGTDQRETVAREVPEEPQCSTEKDRSRGTIAEGPPPSPPLASGAEIPGQNPHQPNGPQVGHANRVYFGLNDRPPAWPEATEECLEDWLRPVPPKPTGHGARVPEVDTVLRKEVLDHRLVLVSCFEAKVSLAACHELIDDLFVGYERKFLFFKSQGEEPTFDIFDQLDPESAKHRVILVEIHHEAEFLGSLRESSTSGIEHIRSRLRNTDTTVICSVPNRILGVSGGAPPSWLSSILYWPISYLRCRLRNFFEAEEASTLESRLTEQRRQSQWPAAEEEFFKEVNHHLSAGPSELKRQVELRSNGALSEESTFSRSEEIFPREGALEQNVLCAAIYFPDLRPRSFKTLVLRLLGDETIEIEEREEVRTPEGEIRILAKKVPQRLSELWSGSPDQVLHRCRLIAAQRPDGSPVIDFTAPHLRRELRRFVEERYPMLVLRIFHDLVRGGALFSPDLPEDLAKALVEGAVEKLVEDPSYFGDGWLEGSVIDLRSRLTIEVDPSDTQEAQLVKLLAALQNEDLWAFFCRRLADLLREMLRHRSLEETVSAFLHRLLRHGHEEAVLDIVLRLMQRLRFVRSFDALSWLRILIDQSREHGRGRALEALRRIAGRSGSEIHRILDEIHSWLPEDDRSPERYSPSNQVAITFIWDYCLVTARSFDLSRAGSWPSHYPFFRTLDPQEDCTRERLQMLLTWLWYPHGVRSSERRETGDREGSIVALGYLLERWILILEGSDLHLGAPPQARSLSRLLLQVAANNLDIHEQRTLIKLFYERQRECLESRAALPVAAREERRLLRVHRQALTSIRRRFADLAVVDPEPLTSEGTKGVES